MNPVMRPMIFLAVALLWAASVGPARAADAPYAKLADVLGTPKLAYSIGPKDKSQLLLKFVPDGENADTWTKMTTVSILKVPEKDTDAAGRGVIAKLRDELKAKHAKIETFDQNPVAPVSCYFVYTVDGATQKGVVYDPAPGFVTVAQVGAKVSAEITHHDALVLKSLIHK
jgi:hypothetical protein